MSVWYKQSAGDETTDGPRVVEPHHAGQTDTALLKAKAAGAEDKGWAVTWGGRRSFTATKLRRDPPVLYVREFWIE